MGESCAQVMPRCSGRHRHTTGGNLLDCGPVMDLLEVGEPCRSRRYRCPLEQAAGAQTGGSSLRLGNPVVTGKAGYAPSRTRVVKGDGKPARTAEPVLGTGTDPSLCLPIRQRCRLGPNDGGLAVCPCRSRTACRSRRYQHCTGTGCRSADRWQQNTVRQSRCCG